MQVPFETKPVFILWIQVRKRFGLVNKDFFYGGIEAYGAKYLKTKHFPKGKLVIKLVNSAKVD